MERVICLLIGYVFGLFQTAYFYGKAKGIDIRKYGSGNAGTTNALRVLGTKAGLIVLAGDCLKCIIAVCITRALFSTGHPENIYLLCLYTGAGAIIGHNFPFYMGFKGGKGIATLLGMVLAIHPEIALVCITIFILTLIASQYVSLSSILATLAFPVLSWLGVFGQPEPLLIVFGFVMFVLVVITHQKNIIRLLNGNENRVNLFKKSKA